MNTYIPGSPAFWIAIMVSIPLLTMRLFAEERRQGTIEALLTVPVTETEVVVAKWLAGVIMYCALLVPFFLYLPFLHFQAKYDFDLGPIMSLSVGLTTMGMMFVSIGLFLSSLTRNQIIAAIWTFVVLLVLIVALCDRLSVRGTAALRVGGRASFRGGPLPDPELRPGPARFSVHRRSSFGVRFHAQPDGKGARDAIQPVTLTPGRGGADTDEIRIARACSRGKNSGWRPRPLAVGLVVAWILRGAAPGQAATAEDDADAPRSGYRDRMIAGVVVGLLLIAGGGYLRGIARDPSTRCRSSRWGSAW